MLSSVMSVRDEIIDLEALPDSYVPAEENSANPIGHFVPPIQEISQLNDFMARYARDDMSRTDDESYFSRKEAVEQEIKRRKKEVPRATSPVGNGLNDSSFADKGLPLDPHLRMLKQNPSFLKIERKPQGGNKGKKVIDSSN
ncbi:hypothetical protein KY289_001468 [Solanum tuberosum]|nr:hypothetical protein KY289_001468 [Solanum tuberosum]